MLIVDIKKRWGDFELDVSFTHQNGVLGLLGASGAGKSAALKCVAGIYTPDSGTVVLDGKTLFDSKKKINLPPQKRDIGYLFQNSALFPNMTVEQNIMSGVKSGTISKKIAAQKIKALYLTGTEKKYPRQLSGGQAQRVALARILAQNPKVVLLDEPFAALDSYLQWSLEEEVTRTLSDFIFVSHNRDEIYRVCDRVCVLNEGRGEKIAATEELFENPETISAAKLSGCKNYTQIKKLGDFVFEALDWGVKLRSANPVGDDIVYAGVRSHFIEITPQGTECEVERVVEELFSAAIIAKPLGGSRSLKIDIQKPALKKIGFDKNFNKNFDKNFNKNFYQKKICVTIDPQRVMLLKS